jgi:hypothetical protein
MFIPVDFFFQNGIKAQKMKCWNIEDELFVMPPVCGIRAAGYQN